MLGLGHSTHPDTRLRNAGAIFAATAALGGLAIFPAPGLATNTVKVGAGESSVVVNGTTISTSDLTLAQLAKLQGVPAATVQAELDGIAANTPAASAVEALIASLPLESSLATALDTLSTAGGGAISPQTALSDVIADEGRPSTAFDSSGNPTGGASGGSNGSAGANGASGDSGADGAGAPGASPAKKRFTLNASSRSLKGRPGKRVRVRFNVSSAAKLSYSGRKLAKGSRKVKSGANVLTFVLPRKRGNYKLVLRAMSTPDGQRAQTTIVLHDAVAKPAKKAHR
jgi:hypothetical protein